MSSYGFMNDRKGRRPIQPPGGESNMNILADASTISPPSHSIRSHHAHNQHMKSQIFDSIPTYVAKEPPRPTNTMLPVQDDGPSGDRRPAAGSDPSYPRSPVYDDRNMNRAPSTPRQDFARPPQIPSQEQLYSSPQNSSVRFAEDVGVTRESPSAASPQQTPRYRRQTDESVDSMFSRYQQSHSRATMGHNDADTVLASAGEPRGAAMMNKYRQSNRGFNVLTGQSELEAATASQRYSAEQTRTTDNEQRMRLARDNRAPAGITPGGARTYIRGQAHDSGPLW